MPLPIIAGGVVLAKKVGAGLAAKKAAGVGATTAGRVATSQAARRTASGKTLQAAKPRKQWDWTNLASNFESNDGGFV